MFETTNAPANIVCRCLRALLATVFLAQMAPAGAGAAAAPAPGLSFLVGDWIGTGSGSPGQGAGSFSFAPDLQKQVLVRRSHSEYPAAGGRPAVVHDDLMIVYGGETKAVYFDNEGHVIHYAIRVDPEARSATFLSTEPSPSPLFRLTYRQREPDEIVVDFAIAPNGKEESLRTYVSGIVRRRAAAS
jgi:hypothetical protein